LAAQPSPPELRCKSISPDITTRTHRRRDPPTAHRTRHPALGCHQRAERQPTSDSPRDSETSAWPTNPHRSLKRHPFAPAHPATLLLGPPAATQSRTQQRGHVGATPSQNLDDSRYTRRPVQARRLRTSHDHRHERHAAKLPSRRSILATQKLTATPRSATPTDRLDDPHGHAATSRSTDTPDHRIHGTARKHVPFRQHARKPPMPNTSGTTTPNRTP